MLDEQVVVHVSTTDWPTLIFAALGTCLAIASLCWQWYSFAVLSGSRIKVQILRGLRGRGAVLTFPETAQAWHVEQAREQGFTEPVFAVVATNSGRGATSVAAVALAFSDGGSLNDPAADPLLPHRIEGEHTQTWYLPAGPAVAYAETGLRLWPDRAANMTVRGRVTLGSGKTVSSKSALLVL